MHYKGAFFIFLCWSFHGQAHAQEPTYEVRETLVWPWERLLPTIDKPDDKKNYVEACGEFFGTTFSCIISPTSGSSGMRARGLKPWPAPLPSIALTPYGGTLTEASRLPETLASIFGLTRR